MQRNQGGQLAEEQPGGFPGATPGVEQRKFIPINSSLFLTSKLGPGSHSGLDRRFLDLEGGFEKQKSSRKFQTPNPVLS